MIFVVAVPMMPIRFSFFSLLFLFFFIEFLYMFCLWYCRRQHINPFHIKCVTKSLKFGPLICIFDWYSIDQVIRQKYRMRQIFRLKHTCVHPIFSVFFPLLLCILFAINLFLHLIFILNYKLIASNANMKQKSNTNNKNWIKIQCFLVVTYNRNIAIQ